ncbi:hypothetical protein BGZ51_009770, partial [Haplosporangium sp. Z 767]
FEKLLGKLESSVATFVQTVLSGQEISLTRTKLADLKKFLVIMMYRSECRRKQYTEEIFDFATRLSIEKHMYVNKISNIQDVWFENLKWFLKTPIEDILKELERANEPGTPSAIMVTYKGPIHVVELLDYGHMVSNYVCIWQAQEGSEFIMSDNCFGCFEGHMGICFHNFFVVSPKYAVVLVNRLYMWDQMKHLPFRKSWFEEKFHANPDVAYSNKNAVFVEDFTPDDVFKYRRIVIPKERVWLVNSIFLDARHKYISYKSNLAMYKTLKYYDKTKGELFESRHDYSVLKRKLFAEMNRTHST